MTIVTKVDFGWQPSEDFTGCVQFPSSERYWYLNGQLHRDDGPAYEYCWDNKNYDKWYLNGVRYDMFHLWKKAVREWKKAAKAASTPKEKPSVSNNSASGVVVVENRDVDNDVNNVIYEFDASRTGALATVLKQYRDKSGLEFVSHTPYGWVFRKV
jgi:hypothetical protein